MEFKRNEIESVAKQLTANSVLFGDEIKSVIGQLTSLMNSAEEFGCPMEATIDNYWGNTIKVKAIPNVKRDEWSF